jgi:hypothetical protein
MIQVMEEAGVERVGVAAVGGGFDERVVDDTEEGDEAGFQGELVGGLSQNSTVQTT